MLRHAKFAAFQLPEMLAVVACIGIFAGLGIPQITDTVSSSKAQVAQDAVALMNRALLHFSQTNWEIVLAPQAETTDDELAVLRTLQWRDPQTPAPGSPYLPLTFPSEMSDSTAHHRVAWNGRAFHLIPPGTDGAGIRINFDSNASATPATLPEEFQPIGSNGND